MSYLSVSGSVLTYNGQTVILRGENFNNEPALGLGGGASDITQINANAADYNQINAWGGNMVRFGLDYNWWVSNPTNFYAVVDQHLAWAAAAHLWMIPTMYIMPDYTSGGYGGQSTFWGTPADTAALVTFWQDFATHYASNPTMAGYDILNEPGPPSTAAWDTLAQNVYNAITAVDTNHFVAIEESSAGGYSLPTVTGSRILWSSHMYARIGSSGGNFPGGDPSNPPKRPYWVGEMGLGYPGPDTYIAANLADFATKGVSWADFVMHEVGFGLYQAYGAGDFSSPWTAMINIVAPAMAGSVKPGVVPPPSGQPGLFQPGAGAVAVPVFTPGARALATAGNRPYIGHLYTNAGGFKELIGPLVEAPSFKISINGGHHPLTVQIASKDPNALRGDLLKLTEQGGDGTVVYTGIIEDLIEGTDPKTGYTIQLQPLVVELGDTPFSHEYYQQTDVAQMARDAVTQAISYGKHLSYTSASIPLTGLTGIFSFVNVTCLRVLEEAKKMAGPYFFYYVDENGLVTFSKADLAGTAAYSVQAQDVLKVQGPITTLYNFIAAIGGTPLTATIPIASVYDNGVIRSGYPMARPSTAISSQFGVRAQTNLAFDTNDQATLDQIVNTIGSQTNRVQTRVELTLIGFNQRIVPGATIRYYETGKYPMNEYRTGAAAYSPVYVVMDNEIDGIVQKLVCSDVPISPDDLAYVIENRLRDALAATQVPSNLLVSPFQLPTLDPLQPSPPGSYPAWGGAPWGGASWGGASWGGSGGGGLSGTSQVVVDLTAGQIANIGDTLVELVPAPGPGKAVIVEFVVYEYTFVSAPYAIREFSIGYLTDIGTRPIAVVFPVVATFDIGLEPVSLILAIAATNAGGPRVVSGGYYQHQAVENNSIVIGDAVDGVGDAAGSGTLRVTLDYHILTLV